MTETRILIADDHQLVREVIASYLSVQGEAAVRLAETLDEALALIASDGPFDVVLLDLAMPGMHGLRGLSSAIEANKGKPVVLFSGQATREIVLDALALGASGFIPKSLPAKSLLNAIRFVMAGEVFLPASYAAATPDPAPSGEKGLSQREMEVLRGIRGGLMNKEIARQMGLSEVTVKMHVRSLCSKLNARNRTHAAMIASELQLD